MTLHEIEETLKQLSSRHPGLNETLLVTLLRSGGWEEKNIQEAVFLFRSGVTGEVPDTSSTGALPSLQTDPVFMPQADEKHLLEEHNGGISPLGEVKVIPPEPQSLIEKVPEPAVSKKEELPHNLPLRPFETSDHIWPFARYRDVFYGDIEPRREVKEEMKMVQPQAVAPPVEVETEKVEMIQEEKATIIIPPAVSEKPSPSVPVTNGDGKLVITACVMLVAVLLLLGYMYSNGRL